MTAKKLSNRRIVAILVMSVLVGVTSWSVGGCAQNTQTPAEAKAPAPSESKDGDVHVKIDLPDTITVK